MGGGTGRQCQSSSHDDRSQAIITPSFGAIMTSRRAQMIAAIGALAVFLVLLIGLRLRGWPPSIIAVLAYAALLWSLQRRPEDTARPPLPDGISRLDHDAAIAALSDAVRELNALAESAPKADRPRLRPLAATIEAIGKHPIATSSPSLPTCIF